jgi:osmotically-inducible protein OsmY
MRKLVLVLAISIAACSRFAAAPDDAAIRDEVRNYLVSDGFTDIAIKVERGVVTLDGSLTTSTQRDKAGSDAERVPGVRRVLNHITTQ